MNKDLTLEQFITASGKTSLSSASIMAACAVMVWGEEALTVAEKFGMGKSRVYASVNSVWDAHNGKVRRKGLPVEGRTLAPGMKVCTSCERIKAESNFYQHKVTKAYGNVCKDCNSEEVFAKNLRSRIREHGVDYVLEEIRSEAAFIERKTKAVIAHLAETL